MFDALEKSLSTLKNSSVFVSDGNPGVEEELTVALDFSDGSRLEAVYWRIIKNGATGLSSFDHQHQYGLPERIDALKELQKELHNKTVTEARFDKETGDLLFQFTGNVKVQVFNVTAYEIWHIKFADGTEEYSNHVRRKRTPDRHCMD